MTNQVSKNNNNNNNNNDISTLGFDTDHISRFLKVFVNCFVCYRYLIFLFVLLWKNSDIWKNGYPEIK